MSTDGTRQRTTPESLSAAERRELMRLKQIEQDLLQERAALEQERAQLQQQLPAAERNNAKPWFARMDKLKLLGITMYTLVYFMDCVISKDGLTQAEGKELTLYTKVAWLAGVFWKAWGVYWNLMLVAAFYDGVNPLDDIRAGWQQVCKAWKNLKF